MILRIAWKNIWRNKLRSSVVIFAIAVGLIAGVFSSSMMVGMMMQRVDAAIHNEVSSLQLHNTDFMENSEVSATIRNSDAILNKLKSRSDISGVSKRISVEAMVNSGHGPMGVLLKGVEVEDEEQVSEIHNFLVDSAGTFLHSKSRNPIVIGHKLAEKLQVHLRSKVQIDMVSKEGLPTSAIFRVVGIYRTDNSMFDELNAYAKIEDVRRLLNLEADECHEIAILAKNVLDTDSMQSQLKKQYTRYIINEASLLRLENLNLKPYIFEYLKQFNNSKPIASEAFSNQLNTLLKEEDKDVKTDILHACESGLNILSWKKLAPDLELTTQYMDMMLYIYVGIILLALGFGIVNTMLMVVLERTKELGMLMAVGMNRRRVYAMVMLETIVLSVVGGIIGLIISYGLVHYFGNVGIDLGAYSEGFNSLGYGSYVYPDLSIASYFQVMIMVIFTGIFAALYPAYKAIKLVPAEAIRTE